MHGFILVEPVGVANQGEFVAWIEMARAYVDRLPAKTAKARRRKRRSGPTSA